MKRDRKQRRSARRRARRRPGDIGQIQSAQRLRNLLEMADEPLDSELSQQLIYLMQIGRADLVDKMKVELVQRAADRALKGKKFPLLKNPTEGELFLGSSTDLEIEGSEVQLPLYFLTRHVGIFGSSGAGKSHFTKWLVKQLISLGVIVLVFDVEDEYKEILPLFPRSKLWWVKPPVSDLCFKINPFEPPERTPAEAWIGRIVSLARAIYFMGDGGSMLLSRILKDLYSQRGCFHGTNNWPSLSHVMRQATALDYARVTRKAGYRETLLRCLQSMADGLGPIADCIQGSPVSAILKQSIIADVSDLDTISAEFFESLLVIKIVEHEK